MFSIFLLDSRETKASNAGRDPAPTHNLVTGQGLLVDGIAPAVVIEWGGTEALEVPELPGEVASEMAPSTPLYFSIKGSYASSFFSDSKSNPYDRGVKGAYGSSLAQKKALRRRSGVRLR